MGTYKIQTENGEYEIETEDTPTNPAPAQEAPNLLNRTVNAVSAGVQGVWNGAKGVLDNIAIDANTHPNLPPGLASIPGAIERMIGHPESIAHNAAGVGAGIVGALTGPLGGAASYPLLNQGAHVINSALGLERPQTAGDAYSNLISDSTGSAIATVAPMVPGAIKGAAQGVRDFAVGLPKENILAESAPRPDIYANTLGAERTVGANETRLTQQADNYHQAFTRENPVAGIQAEAMSGPEAFTQFKGNLDSIYVKAIKDRDSVLQQASQAEVTKAGNAQASGAPVSIGITYEDIPHNAVQPNGLTSGLDLIRQQRPNGVAGVDAAVSYLQEQFGVTPAEMFEGTAAIKTPANPGRPISAIELNQAISAFDNQIAELGGYDVNNPHPVMSPSSLDANVSAMKYLRGQLSDALQGHISNMVGPEAATQFSQAGQNVGMAKNYKMLADRFQTETGQAFSPNLPKQSQPGTSGGGFVKETISALAPEAATARMQTRALGRETAAIRDLQALVDFNSGVRAQPAPRSWAQIKTSAQHMGLVGNAAMALGIIKNPQELLSAPDALGKKVVGLVAQQAPQLFVPTPDNVNVIDGQFQNPMDKDLIIQESMELPPLDRAMRIGSTFANKYVPTPQIPPVQRAMPALPATMEQINKSLSIPPSKPDTTADSSYDHSNMSMLEKLTQSKALNSGDYH